MSKVINVFSGDNSFNYSRIQSNEGESNGKICVLKKVGILYDMLFAMRLRFNGVRAYPQYGDCPEMPQRMKNPSSMKTMMPMRAR